MFESLIREAASRFNLGEDAPGFVRTLLDAIFDKDGGGLAGLRERFANVGLGSQFASWIGGNPGDDALQPEQFAAGFGSDAIGNIAGKFGLSGSTVAAAGAFLLPKLVGASTPGGNIPDGVPGGLPGGLGAAMHGVGESVRDFGGAAAGAAGAALGTAGGAVRDAGGAAIDAMGAAGSAARDAGGAAIGAAGDALRDAGAGLERGVEAATGGGWWKWLLALLLLIGAFFLFRGCNKQEATDPAADATAIAEPATDPAAGTDAAAPAGADAAMADPAADPAMTDAAAATDPAATGDGTADAASTADAAAGADPNAAADSALSGIKSGASADEVTNALNLMIIHFATGSADISADSDAILTKAAAAIKALPAGTRLEVGGHTDNTGNASANQDLSQRRADAVVARLGELGVAAGTLTGKGYGQDQPKAENDTAEGRAENRRIEFTAMQ